MGVSEGGSGRRESERAFNEADRCPPPREQFENCLIEVSSRLQQRRLSYLTTEKRASTSGGRPLITPPKTFSVRQSRFWKPDPTQNESDRSAVGWGVPMPVGLAKPHLGPRMESNLLQFFKDDGQNCSLPPLTHSQQPLRLFCYSVVMPSPSYEVGLLKYQMGQRAGIFSCDSFAVFSNVSSLDDAPEIPVVQVIHGPMTVPRGDSWMKRLTNGDALNTPLFMHAWKWFADTKTHEQYDWTIKLDADTVFYAPLLRLTLAERLPISFSTSWQCDHAARTDPFALTFWGDWLPGPIEALNSEAMNRILARVKRCAADMPPDEFGEDIWLSRCREEADELHEPVASCIPLGDRLLQWAGVPIGSTARCELPDSPTAALHPFKSVEQQKTCLTMVQRAAASLYHVNVTELPGRHAPEAEGSAFVGLRRSAPALPVTCGSVWCWKESREALALYGTAVS